MILPDQAQRLRVLTDHSATLLVEAGAGSGKTALMAGRVVLMLAAGVQTRHLAAITFTELAAGQLFVRICGFLDQLLAGVVPPPLQTVLPCGLTPAQRQNLEQARQSLGALTTTTIHGFCQALIGPYSVEAGMDPGARVMDEFAADLAWQDLYEDFVRAQLDTEATGPMAACVMAGTAAESEFAALARCLRRYPTAQAASVASWKKRLHNLEVTVEKFCKHIDRLKFKEEKIHALGTALRTFVADYTRGLATQPASVGLMRCAQAPPQCTALTQKPTWRKWAFKTICEQAAAAAGLSKAVGSQASATCQSLYEAVGLAWKSLQSELAAAAFGELADEFSTLRHRFQAYKRRAALLDFDDLLRYARELLRTHEDVRCALGQRYQHVLVDEFQDTDPLQAEILWRLCGEGPSHLPWQERQLRPGALFCVGDPKQAVYRFRGADVDTYVTAREAIRRQAPDSVVEITANFRSLEPILSWVNDRFRAQLSSAGQPGFRDLCATQPSQRTTPAVVRLDVPVEEGSLKQTIREAEAAAVASVCQQLIGRPRADGQRIRASDIALLAPVGTNLWCYEAALEKCAIPVASQAGKGFFRRQEVQDLIALTRTLADARDTLALGALLRGPLVGLTEEELLDIIAELAPGDDPDRIPHLTLWTAVEHIRHPLAAELLSTLQGLARRAYSTTPFQILAEAVEALRIRAIIGQRHRVGMERPLANIDLYLEMARAYDGRGLRAFAQDMRSRWEDTASQVEGHPDAHEQAVHLMTMHSAKGLEWPIVIAVNTCAKLIKASGILHDRLTDTLHNGLLGMIRTTAYEEGMAQEQAQEDRERVRLLYVACTRAKELLILPRLTQAESGWLALIDLGLDALPALELQPEDCSLPSATEECVNAQTATLFEEQARNISAARGFVSFCTPSRHEAQALAADEQMHMEGFVFEEEDPSSVRGGPLRGRVLHKLLEEVLNSETTQEPAALESRARELLEQLGEKPAQDASLGCAPAELARVVLSTFALAPVADLRQRLMPEMPVYGHEKHAQMSHHETATVGVVDALALTAAGEVLAVVDWKSDVVPTTAQRQKYHQQMRDYLQVTGARQGWLVYLTVGQVERVEAPT